MSIAVAAAAGLLILALGLGWAPPGGRQFAAFGDSTPRFLVPWTCGVLAVLAFTLTVSSTVPAWRFPWLTRAAIGVGGAALGAQTVVMGWIVSAVGISTGPARVAGWAALVCGAAVALVPQAVAERLRLTVAGMAATPFAMVLGVWLTAGTAPEVPIPGGPVISIQDTFAQATITIVGALTAGVGILVLWSLILSTRQARDIGEGVAAVGSGARGALEALVAVKVAWLVAAYGGLAFAESVEAGSSDGPGAWVLGIGFALGALTWVVRVPRRPVPSDLTSREVVRWVGLGFAGVFVASVAVALASALMAVWPTTGPSETLNDVLGWLASGDPPVALWWIVGTVAVATIAVWPLRRVRLSGRRAWVAAAVVAAWGLPRAVELVFRILEWAPPFDSPSLVTFDTALTIGLAAAVVAARVRGSSLPESDLVIVLVVSTLVAHPLGIMPAAWQSGPSFYLLLVYPILYKFLFDSTWVNESDPGIRPGRVLRIAGFTALLVATNAMLILLGRAGPGIDTVEAVILGAIGEAYLLVPVGALVVAAALQRRADGDASEALGTRATRRWLWESASARLEGRLRRSGNG